MIYILILLYTIYLVCRYDINKKTRWFNLHYRILLLLSICIVGFSFRLGLDTIGYMTYFDTVDPNLNWTFKHLADLHYEPIPELLFSLCKSVGGDFTLVQFAIGAFVNITVFWFFRKHSPMFFFTILLYFIFQYWNINFEIKRESIAISFFLIAVDNLLKEDVKLKDYISYYIFCLFAVISHRFAFLTLIYPFIKYLKLSRVTVLILIFLAVLSLLKISFLTNIMMSLNYIVANLVGDSFQNYLGSSRFGTSDISVFGVIHSIILPIIILFQMRNYKDRLVLSFGAFYLFCSVLQSQIFIFYRLHNYFCWFIFLLYASFFRKIAVYKIEKGITSILFLFIIVFQLYTKTSTSNFIRYAPYSSIFTKEINNAREMEYTNLDYMLNH